MRDLAGKLIRLISWLCFEHEWTQWELMIVAAVVLSMLLLTLRLLRKRTLRRAAADELSERSPIIGLRLAEHKRSRREIRNLGKSRTASAPQRHSSRKERRETAEQMDTLKGQIAQLQSEITEHGRTEARLRHKIAELSAAGGRPQPQERTQPDTSFEQQLTQLTTANKRLRDELVKHRQTEVRLEQQIDKLKAANARLEQQTSEQKPSENIPVQGVERKPRPRRRSGPLNTEELSRLAELGRRLAPPRSS